MVKWILLNILLLAWVCWKLSIDDCNFFSPDNIYGFGYFVGQNGDIWYAQRENGVNKWKYEGLNSLGVPIYNSTGVKFSMPPLIQDIKRIEYVDSEDTMYLCGFSTSYPDLRILWYSCLIFNFFLAGGTWWCGGRVLQRYDNWHTNRTLRWQIPLTFAPNEGNAVRSIAVCGKYVFVAFFQSAKVEVYHAQTAEQVLS